MLSWITSKIWIQYLSGFSAVVGAMLDKYVGWHRTECMDVVSQGQKAENLVKPGQGHKTWDEE